MVLFKIDSTLVQCPNIQLWTASTVQKFFTGTISHGTILLYQVFVRFCQKRQMYVTIETNHEVHVYKRLGTYCWTLLQSIRGVFLLIHTWIMQQTTRSKHVAIVTTDIVNHVIFLWSSGKNNIANNDLKLKHYDRIVKILNMTLNKEESSLSLQIPKQWNIGKWPLHLSRHIFTPRLNDNGVSDTVVWLEQCNMKYCQTKWDGYMSSFLKICSG
jgi:hypothetical protein